MTNDKLEILNWDKMPKFSNPMNEIEMTSQPDAEDIEDAKNNPFFDGDPSTPYDWMDLSVMAKEPERLINGDAVVLDAPSARLVLTYPIENPVVRTIHAPDGIAFKRADLMKAILETYEAIYFAETHTQSVPTPCVEERVERPDINLLNRPASDGMFGVSMHDIEDLGVSSVTAYQVQGDIWLEPSMES